MTKYILTRIITHFFCHKNSHRMSICHRMFL
nr:MAG TPA: hypothetical protein [Caudoviricetes sp.]DAZ18560.1 MAG TPA: hypothetical protein [Caudoviricetes sp.]